MCCGTKICCLCTCFVLVVLAIGFLFGFGVFQHGFHKLKDTVHVWDPPAVNGGGRPFVGFGAPAPF